jgi:tetratricopeptide (TPR) repeat protein
MDIQRLNRAVELRDSNDLEAALETLQELETSTTDPIERASVLLNQSTVLARMGRVSEALGKSREAMKLSTSPEVQCNALVSYASGLALAGKREAALAELERALKEYPQVLEGEEYRFLYEDLQVRRGLLLVQLTRLQEARSVLEECNSFDLSSDDRWRVLYNLGRCYLSLKEPHRSKLAFLEFLKHAEGADLTHIASAHFLLGTIYYNEGADAKALMEFEWLLPRLGDAGMPESVLYTWLGKTHKMLGNKAQANKYEALAKKPDH